MYDGLRQRRSGVDHFFSPSQQTSTRATLAYAHARFSTVPGADLVIDPDHGHWLIVCRRRVCFIVAFVINI